MQLIKEYIDEERELSQDERSKLAKDIKSKFNLWNEKRQRQIDDAKEIMKEVYLNQDKINSDDETESWKADVKLNKLYALKKVKTACYWSEIWSNPQQMFDVRGSNKETEKNSKIQKAAIVDSLEKMEIGKEFDVAIDYLFDIGEMIFITDWEQRSKTVMRPDSQKGFVLQALSRVFKIPLNNKLTEISLPYYENARVTAINPFMFVFNPTCNPRKKKEWDRALKIYKRFETLEDLKDNKIYKITKEVEEELKIEESNTSIETKTESDLIEESQYDDRHEVLYVHGDFRINGRIYKNYIAEILNGKHLIRFEKNPMYINPFIWLALEINPETQRGISALKCVKNLAKEQEKMINTTIDMQQLGLNPPTWVDETLVDENDTKIKVYPGYMKRFKNGYSGSLPVPMTLGQNNLSQTIYDLESIISNVSTVNNNMHGNLEPEKRTATEVSLADKGSSTQVAKDLDIINQNGIIPIIKNVAELLAMFKDGYDVVYTMEKGKQIEYTITNEIRQAQYTYFYEDRNAILDRKSKFNELFNLFINIAKDSDLKKKIDWKNVIETAVEMIGFDNTDKFFVKKSPLSQVFEQLEQMPPEIQEQISINLIQQIQPILQQYQEAA